MILVTGGTGFVGQALVEQLLQRGHRVRLLVRPRGNRVGSARPAGVEVLELALHDTARIALAMRSVDTVFHLAGGVQGSAAELVHANVECTRHVAQAAAAVGVRRFVHLSSAGVYGESWSGEPHDESSPLNPTSDYERSKRDGEDEAREALGRSSIPLVVLRPAGLYGGRRPATQAFLRDIARRRVWFRTPPRMIVHPTYIDDLLQALLACIDRNDIGGRVFNVAGASALSLDEWAAAVASAMGTGLRQVAVPGDAARALAAGCAAVLRAFRVAPPHRLARLIQPVVSRALNTEQARTVLGLEPMTLEAGLRRTVDSALSQGTLSNLVSVQN